MNLSVALRQTYFSDFTSLLFFWPLPMLGVPQEAFFLAIGVLSTYESLMHNRLIDRTGFFGRIFNCPSFHRLHHACDEQYRDKNYASTLIVWDRMFGTFVEETAPPTYGTVTPHIGHNPVWAQVEPMKALMHRVRQAPSFRDACAVLLREPGWIAPWEEARDSAITERPPRIDVPVAIAAYTIAQTIVAVICAELVLLLVWRGTSPIVVAPAVVLLIASPVAFGGLFEQKRWILIAEPIRIAFSAVVFGHLFIPAYGTISIVVLVTWLVASALVFSWIAPRRVPKQNGSTASHDDVVMTLLPR